MRGSLVFSLCLFWFSSTCAVKPIVETKQGSVSGIVLKTLSDVEYFGFMGIPFAKPPINNLRFLPPQPPQPWDEILPATKEKPACIQNNFNIRKGSPFGIYGSEDCLYLNVYSPDINEKLPVLVFIYNEQFRISYNLTRDYAPDFFIEENLVVVTISHRLSTLGFLSFEDKVLEGNSGLKDIVAGLEWIKKNIYVFGGDPGKVTLMGALGGGAAVDMLVQSKAKHLFHAAIIQGGSSWSSMYLQENPRDRAIMFAEALELPSFSSHRTIIELGNLDSEVLIKKEYEAIPKDYFKEEQKMLLPIGPIVEKDPDGLLTSYPEDSKYSVDIPVMIGFNSAEGIDAGIQYLIEPRYLSYVDKDFPLHMPIRVKYKFDPMDDEFYTAIEHIKQFYIPDQKYIRIVDIPKYINYLGDVVTSYAVDKTLKAYANISSKPVYYYHFDYESALNENKNSILSFSTFIEVDGASPGDELCYLFKCPKLLKEYKKDNEHTKFQKKLVRMWANFAKYGNPTPDNDAILHNLHWKPYNIKDKEYLNIGKEIKLSSNLLEERFNFWDNILEEWSRQAVNGLILSRKPIKDEL